MRPHTRSATTACSEELAIDRHGKRRRNGECIVARCVHDEQLYVPRKNIGLGTLRKDVDMVWPPHTWRNFLTPLDQPLHVQVPKLCSSCLLGGAEGGGPCSPEDDPVSMVMLSLLNNLVSSKNNRT